jgi:hypothetical protein
MVAIGNKRLKFFQRGGSKLKCRLGAFLALGAAACVFIVQLVAMSAYSSQGSQSQRRQNIYHHQRVFPLHEVKRDHPKPLVVSRAMRERAQERAQMLVPVTIPPPSDVNQQGNKAEVTRAKKGGGPRKANVIKALFAANPPISEHETPSRQGDLAQKEAGTGSPVGAPQLTTNVVAVESSEPKAQERHEPKPVMSEILSTRLDHRKEKVFTQLLTPMYSAEDVAKMIALVQEQDPANRYALCRVSDCDTVNDNIRAFNPWERDLFLCGELIKAQTSIEIVKPCHENTRVYKNELSGTGITKMCLDLHNQQIDYPFVETIIEKIPSGHNFTVTAGKTTCRDKFKVPLLKTLGSWQRTVWHHDGVVDITLEGRSSDTYQIEIPMHVHSTMLRDHVYAFQGNTSRVVVIVDPRISVSNPSLGVLHMQTSQTCHQPKRIRVIKESWKKHKRADQNHTETMLSEFMSPVQFFRVVKTRT